jgi:phosphoribosyl 1,2-cyclic phosphate phosphodiesterase
VTVEGAGGPVTFAPFTVEHGTIPALGFRMGDLAYLPDVSMIPEEAWPSLEGLGTFVVDALRYKPHPTHAHLGLALEWIARARPDRAVITNMHVDLDFATLGRELPDGVIPAHDGLSLPFTP